MTAVARFATCSCILLGLWAQVAVAQQPAPADEDQTVTPADVKRFLDPTLLTSGIRYDFGYIDQPDGTTYGHTFSLDLALGPQHLLFADIPVMRTTTPGATEAGIGDVSFGYVFVPYQNLERRFTTVAFRVDAAIPAGAAATRRGWALALAHAGGRIIGHRVGPSGMAIFPVTWKP